MLERPRGESKVARVLLLRCQMSLRVMSTVKGRWHVRCLKLTITLEEFSHSGTTCNLHVCNTLVLCSIGYGLILCYMGMLRWPSREALAVAETDSLTVVRCDVCRANAYNWSLPTRRSSRGHS
eukprot:5428851-Pleurochrysis_carterae.AAC.2